MAVEELEDKGIETFMADEKDMTREELDNDDGFVVLEAGTP